MLKITYNRYEWTSENISFQTMNEFEGSRISFQTYVLHAYYKFKQEFHILICACTLSFSSSSLEHVPIRQIKSRNEL